ncbi:MAG: GyrI-like domain-containing protein [Nitrososphaeria archaeon]
MVEKVKAEIIKKKGIKLVEEIRLERITEGKCVQIRHVGPYSTELKSLSEMKKKSLIENGLHHEIYLSDPRRASGEKMKTILRQPVKERT